MIKRFIPIVLSAVITCLAYAAPMNIECTGAKMVVNGTDTLFFFKDAINVHSKLGAVDWYNIETGQTETGIEDQYNLDEGGYYIIKDGVKYSPFYVFKYTEPAITALTITPDCNATTLKPVGALNPFTYTRTDNTQGTYARTYSLSYNALAWDGEAWVDSAALDSGKLASSVYLPPLYDSTLITFCIDAAIHAKLGLDSACLEAVLAVEDVKAVNFQLTSLATTRGDENERSNERNRPTSQTLITGNEYSGALEVAFYSNPTPAARFFRWDIYHSTEHLVTRTDQDIRFTFVEPGAYRVVCSVNNGTCEADSMETTVAIAESYLAVPNVFTPNGDGQNDEFRVAYRSLKEFHIWVYNRWGKLVYESTDPAKGWDGTINGRNAAEGAYFYVVRALGTDADKQAGYMSKISYTKKKLNSDEAVIGIYQMSGDINLLRGKR